MTMGAQLARDLESLEEVFGHYSEALVIRRVLRHIGVSTKLLDLLDCEDELLLAARREILASVAAVFMPDDGACSQKPSASGGARRAESVARFAPLCSHGSRNPSSETHSIPDMKPSADPGRSNYLQIR